MIYFTSDLHFFHQNVIKYCGRPYSSIEDMNEDLVKKWNSVVNPDDAIYCLGDFSLAFRPVEIFSHRLNGIKHLVPGNHDWNHSYNKKSRSPVDREKWHQKYRDHGWIILPEQTTLDIPGLSTFNLCHHPYADASGRDGKSDQLDKYADWRPIDDGRILLHGHVHEHFLCKKSNKGTLMINVGVDVWGFTPISIDQIAEIIKANS